LQLPQKNVGDDAAWKDLVQQARAERWGWTAFKFQGDGIPRALDPEYTQPGHDRYLRNLKTADIRQIVHFMEVVRGELGQDGEFGIDLHWHYDTRDAIELAKALGPVKPMWIEDPVPPENPEAMALVRRESPVPVCTGENLYGFQGFERLIELQGCDGVHIDIPKSGGLLESKRISDFAATYDIWTAAHNPASPVGTIASAHAASAMRNFHIHELAKYVEWWPDLVIHEGPIWENGYLAIQDKPGYGIELNPDVARAHLAPGETWWG
jgi:L-alanine-DL-glutamate epimerase-like enolase superfamily enzyme